MEPPFTPRQFVWCQFPYIEEPLRPGPDEHIGYVADVRQIRGNSHLTVMSIYTTTAPWAPDTRLPPGVIPIEPSMAATMNQKGFVMDARRVAFIPVTAAFFPRLSEPNKGIVHTASQRFHVLVQNTLVQLAKRPQLVVKLGPDAPGAVRRGRSGGFER
ncbi:MAG: hypothetical protein BroJett029_05360 [Alphaproteobacteria bacterium]|jgi:hypothetical protein|nr:MAG: hypothetical protein BroJett029_05360 [Alphaproteobacteria bacterium]